MAGLRQRRGKWYARIYIWDGSRRSELQIPLRTNSKAVALDRLATVKKYERDIKNDLNISFPWLNDEGTTKVLRRSLSYVIQKFNRIRGFQGLAASTLKRNSFSLNLFIKATGKNIPLDSVSTADLENFKEYSLTTLENVPVTINIDLRILKTFFKWCVLNNYLTESPRVNMFKIPKSLPKYLTESDIAEIMRLNTVDSFYKKVFYFHMMTGCRLSEPYYGKLDGHWLIIPAQFTKQKVEFEICLTTECLTIFTEMIAELNNWLGRGYKMENFTGKISKQFLQACRDVGIDHRFHDLRHTFGVRRYLESRDIYRVKKEMGHASVTTTEIYAKFSLRRLAHDFPTLAAKSKFGASNGEITDTNYTDTEVDLSSVER